MMKIIAFNGSPERNRTVTCIKCMHYIKMLIISKITGCQD